MHLNLLKKILVINLLVLCNLFLNAQILFPNTMLYGRYQQRNIGVKEVYSKNVIDLVHFIGDTIVTETVDGLKYTKFENFPSLLSENSFQTNDYEKKEEFDTLGRLTSIYNNNKLVAKLVYENDLLSEVLGEGEVTKYTYSKNKITERFYEKDRLKIFIIYNYRNGKLTSEKRFSNDSIVNYKVKYCTNRVVYNYCKRTQQYNAISLFSRTNNKVTEEISFCSNYSKPETLRYEYYYENDKLKMKLDYKNNRLEFQNIYNYDNNVLKSVFTNLLSESGIRYVVYKTVKY